MVNFKTADYIKANRGIIYALLFLWGIAWILAFIKLRFYLPETTGDFYEYLDAARYFSGIEVPKVPYHRLIKPVQPAITGLINIFTKDFSGAFFIQVGIFYALLVPSSFFLFKEFFRGRIYPAVLATLLFIGGYPMLRSGIAPYTETGAWFFYILSLYISLRFMRSPSIRWVWINLAVSIIGFLYKEYSLVSLVIMNGAIVFTPGLPRQLRIKYLMILDGIFVMLNAIWQGIVYVLFDYNFGKWFLAGQRSSPAYNRMWYIQRSFFALLIGGWIFVPAAALRLKELLNIERRFLALLLTVPLVCLLWGAVLSRLFYVMAPGLIILSVLGLEKVVPNKWVSGAVVFAILVLNLHFLSKGGLYVF